MFFKNVVKTPVPVLVVQKKLQSIPLAPIISAGCDPATDTLSNRVPVTKSVK